MEEPLKPEAAVDERKGLRRTEEEGLLHESLLKSRAVEEPLQLETSDEDPRGPHRLEEEEPLFQPFNWFISK